MSRLFSLASLTVLVFLAVSAHAGVAWAQGSGAAAVTGTVVDPSGGAVVAASVVVRNDATGYVRAVVTDGSGHFSATSMPVAPGRNIAILVEVAARNQLLRARGHHAARALADRLDRSLREASLPSPDEEDEDLEPGGGS